MKAMLALLGGLNPILLTVATLGAMLALPLDYDDPYKIVPEIWLVSWAFVLTATLGLEAALRGQAPLGAALPRWVGPSVWLLWGVAALSCLLGVKPSAHLGYLPTVVAYSAFSLSLATWFQLEGGRRRFGQGLLASVAALQVFIAIGQHGGWWLAWAAKVPSASFLGGYLRVIAGNGTYIGTVGNINYLGELLVLLLPGVGAWAWGFGKGWGRGLGLALTAGLMLMLFITGARGALLGLLVAYPLAAAFLQGWKALDPRPHLRSHQAKLAAAGLTAFLGVGLAIAGTTFWNKVQQSLAGAGDNDVMSRVVNWEVGFKIFTEHPITGAGLGSFKLLSVPILAAMFPDGIPEPVTMARFYQLHNDPLQSLVELGVVGFLALGLVSWVWGRSVRRAHLSPVERWAGLAGMGALTIAGSFGFPFHIPLTAYLAMWVLALALAPPAAPVGVKGDLPGLEGPGEGPALEAPEPSPSLPPLGGGLALPSEALPPPHPVHPWALPLGLGALVVVGLVGVQAHQRVLGPMGEAAHLRFYANQMAETQRPEGAEVLYAAATRLDRYKAPGIFQQLKLLTVLGRDAEIIETYEALQKSVEGMGMDSRLIYANALKRQGRLAEARAAYDQVAHYYAPGGYNRVQAEAQIRLLVQSGGGAASPAAPPRP